MRKRFLSLVAVFPFLGFLFAGSAAVAQPQAAGSKTRIGVVLPMTGANAESGAQLKSAAELAKSELSTQAQDTFELIFQDDQSSSAAAQSAFGRLEAQFKADMIIAGGTDSAADIAPLAEKKSIPTLALTQDPGVTSSSHHVLRHALDLDRETEVLQGEITRRNLSKVFVVHTKSARAGRQMSSFRNLLGGIIAQEQEVAPGASDFSQLGAAVKNAGADSLLLAVDPGQFGALARQLKNAQLNLPVFAYSTLENIRDLRTSARDMDGFVFTGAMPSEAFIQKYVKRFGSPPLPAAAEMYDAVRIAAAGAAKMGNSRPALSTFIHRLDSFGGALGSYTAKGDLISVPVYLKEIKGGTIRLFTTEEGKVITPLKSVAEQEISVSAPSARAEAASEAAAAAPSRAKDIRRVLILILVALLITIVGVGLWYWASTRDQSRVQGMVQGLLSASGIGERLTKNRLMSDEELDLIKRTSRDQKAKQDQVRGGSRMGGEVSTSLSDKLFRAGFFTTEERQRHERRQIIFPIVGFAVGLVAALSMGAMLWVVIAFPVLGLAVGWQLPSTLLDRTINKRQDETLYYLPLVIEQISIGVSSSLDIWPCISNILDMAKVRNTLNPVTELFLYVEKLVASGLNLQEALDEVAVACGITQVQMAFKFLGQCAEHGGEVSKQLQDLANAVMRERQTQIEGIIASLPVKATGPLFLVFAGFFILMLAGIFTRLLTSLNLQ